MAPALLTFAYNVARTPLAVLDVAALRRLPADSTVRQLVDRGFGSMDLVAGRLLADENLIRQGSERLGMRSPAPAPQVAPDEPEEPEDRPRPAPVADGPRRARAAATKAKQHDAARPNQSVQKIAQRLQQTEAVAEARDHTATE